MAWALEAIVLAADRHRPDVELGQQLGGIEDGSFSPMQVQSSLMMSRAFLSDMELPFGSVTWRGGVRARQPAHDEGLLAAMLV
jgi:hypothetical protein